MSHFRRWWQAGFTDLLSVTPPGAALSPRSDLKPEDLGKVPGLCGRQGLWHGYDWRRTAATAAMIPTWDASGANVGLRTDRYPCADLDVRPQHAWVVDEIVLLAELRVGPAPARVGQAPKTLLMFRTDTPMRRERIWFRMPGEDGPENTSLIELLGDGQQVVVDGIHPKTGKPYVWDRHPCDRGPAGLTELTVETARDFLDCVRDLLTGHGFEIVTEGGARKAAERAGIDQDGLASDPEAVAAAVAVIPNDNAHFESRTDYIRMGCAIKAACRQDPAKGREIWLDWALKWEGNDRSPGNDPDTALADWERMQPPFEIGAPYVFELARNFGYSTASQDFEVVDVTEGAEDWSREEVLDSIGLLRGLAGEEPDRYEALKAVWAERNVILAEEVDRAVAASATHPNDIDTRLLEKLLAEDPTAIEDPRIERQLGQLKKTAPEVVAKLRARVAGRGRNLSAAQFDAAVKAGLTGLNREIKARLQDETGVSIEALLKRYVYCARLESFVDITTKQVWSRSQFKDKFPEIGHPSDRDGNAAAVFLTHPKRVVADEPIYKPGAPIRFRENGLSYVNTWRPPTLVPTTGDVTPWLELVEHVIPDAQAREVVLDYLAFLVQRPAEKINWAICITSDVHGIGKGMLMKPVIEGLGAWNASVIGPDDLAGGWSDFLEARLVVVEEMMNFERKAVMNRLKGWITAPPDVLRINKKGIPQYNIPNILGFVFFSNHDDALFVEPNDRRFFIYNSPAGRRDGSYYGRVAHWLDQGGNAHVMDWLLKRKITINPKDAAPMTAHKQALIDDCKPDAVVWAEERIRDGEGVFAKNLVTAGEIARAIEFDETLKGLKQTPTERWAGRWVLKPVGAVCLGRIRINGRQERVWAVRDTAAYEGMTARELAAAYQEEVELLAEMLDFAA